MRQTCTETLSLIRQISADSGIEADCSVSLFNSPAILTSYGESESWVHLETTTEPLVRQPVRTAVKTTSSAWRCLMAGHSHQTIRDIMRHSRIQVGADMVELLTNKNCVCIRTHWLPLRIVYYLSFYHHHTRARQTRPDSHSGAGGGEGGGREPVPHVHQPLNFGGQPCPFDFHQFGYLLI